MLKEVRLFDSLFEEVRLSHIEDETCFCLQLLHCTGPGIPLVVGLPDQALVGEYQDLMSATRSDFI